MSRKTEIKGILFDMDGTMVDNMMVHHRAWKNKLAKMGLILSLDEVKEKVHGINEEILERLFGDRFTPEQRKQISYEKEAEYRRIFLTEIKPLPGLMPFLNALYAAEVPMAITTAAPPENVDFVLEHLPIKKYFQSIWHSKSVTKGKPHPEIYLKASESLSLAPENCLVFEDSPTGVEAAQKAGCPTVVVLTTHSQEEFERFTNVIQYISDFTGLNAIDFIP